MIEKYLRLQDGLSEWVGRVIAWFALVLILTLIYEVVSRYFFNAPTIWSHELSTMIFGAFAILSGSYTLKHLGHVRSDVVYLLLPARLQRFCDILVYSIGLFILAVFLVHSIDFALKSWEAREVSARSIWQPPLYYIKSVIPIAVLLLMLQSLAELVRAVLLFLNISFTDPRHSVSVSGDDDV
ncbi:C4-dicarboxylate ABC transporter substrate-binding protein [Oligella sp. HMSC05A10]|uniref:TRAP transporter small permease subunit n=1 Tax=Oligella TaxID=90243 RepID=UPI00036DF4E0|nr:MULTISPECIES: TRAP transporter small permease subunit [Oligella]AVL70205.1 C4-dicarboxylate ABC transporter substrate-binding protein [Oligella urethralis]OFS88523.1 C4-dicarboxylate ABC transporter substrate-binding protein [Oligella sp. HMSC05A10]OFV50861.1 C4-dicarboxylate ABC transporter substrate-binding protein [Oligella sp. HMSC09E12]PMC17633.1 C4-dicarboxylate ABC transporter substrate-binding protein [Oligella urethralis]SUA53246.1 Neu5Ac permease [Oligella urethralis]